jgi:hypothetical protein
MREGARWLIQLFFHSPFFTPRSHRQSRFGFSRRKSCLSALLSASVLEAAAGFSLCVQISVRGSSSSAELILRTGVSDRIAQALICFASQSLCASFVSSPTVALAPRSVPPAVFVQFFRTTCRFFERDHLFGEIYIRI